MLMLIITLMFWPTSEMNTLHSMVLFSISKPVSWTGTFSKLAMSRAHDSVLPAHLGLAARSPRKLHTHNFHVHMHNTHANLFLPGTLA